MVPPWLGSPKAQAPALRAPGRGGARWGRAEGGGGAFLPSPRPPPPPFCSPRRSHFPLGSFRPASVVPSRLCGPHRGLQVIPIGSVKSLPSAPHTRPSAYTLGSLPASAHPSPPKPAEAPARLPRRLSIPRIPLPVCGPSSQRPPLRGFPSPSWPAWWSTPGPPPLSPYPALPSYVVPSRPSLSPSQPSPPHHPYTRTPPSEASPGAPPLPPLVYAPPTHPVLLSPLWSLSPPPLPHSRPRSPRARSYLPRVPASRPLAAPRRPPPSRGPISALGAPPSPPRLRARQPGRPPGFPARSSRRRHRHGCRGSPTHPSRAGGSRSSAVPPPPPPPRTHTHTHSLRPTSSGRLCGGPAPRGAQAALGGASASRGHGHLAGGRTAREREPKPGRSLTHPARPPAAARDAGARRKCLRDPVGRGVSSNRGLASAPQGHAAT
ncbi:unnamed protein product [Rangifer tarandus platyrhynchus]|uniref:Basic proline-rich protein-like n=1 Tax=Rangifer tarandus platyrhynchus TaxID=3082113 RepID=A0ABN9A6R2_RANTA|nr:unnamed protein product [Rangifer tarandus platyrhynchus]